MVIYLATTINNPNIKHIFWSHSDKKYLVVEYAFNKNTKKYYELQNMMLYPCSDFIYHDIKDLYIINYEYESFAEQLENIRDTNILYYIINGLI